jgi:electron transfer flavoprotein alpha subunit
LADIRLNQKILVTLTREQLLKIHALCPFHAIEENTFEINSGCKMCKLCVKNGPAGLFEFIETEDSPVALNKNDWKGVAVYIECSDGKIHPVSLELLGKARELAQKVNFPVYALILGRIIKQQAEETLHYGADGVFAYDYPELEHFLIEPYTNVFEDFVSKVKPSAVLVGATVTGRSLAPSAAARLKTGLTADCTKLDIKENTDLIQIRPAFGGNIMARIRTPNHRPQLATVRYKIFNAPERSDTADGRLNICEISRDKLKSRISIVEITEKEKTKTISEAEIIVAAGRGVKSEKDLSIVYDLAEALGAEVASSRPLAEAGWVPANRQIGLSGRTVKPRLIITLGVSGSVQFKAGMENSDLIISINTDENAAIFDVCHYAVKGDLYDIVPRLTAKIKEYQRV